MVEVGSIKEIQRSSEEIRFQWSIGDFLSLNPSHAISSPYISWHDASWLIWVGRNSERLRLYLDRDDGGRPFTLKVSVGLRGPAGVQHQREWEGEFHGRDVWPVWRGDSFSPLLADVRSNLLQPGGSLVVRCHMKIPARDPCPQVASEATNEGIASSEKRDAGATNEVLESPGKKGREEVESLKFEIKTLQLRVKKHKLEEEHHRKMADVHKNMADGHKCQLEEKMTLLSRLERDQQSTAHCVVCLENPVDSVLYRCGHMCMCYGCAFQLKTSNSQCPICRCDIQDVIKFYR